MIRFRNLLTPMVAALVGAAVLGAPTKAHATFRIFAQEAGVNGGNITQLGADGIDFTNIVVTQTYGDFSLTIFGASSDNGAILSDLLTATVSLKNNSTTSKTITLWASQSGYNVPVGIQLRVESGLSGTVNNGTLSGTGDFQGFADKNNNILAAGTLTGGAAVTDFTNGSQNGVFNVTTFDTGSAVGLFNRTTANSLYSLTSRATFTVSGSSENANGLGGQGNFSSHINVTATPAPAGLVLALTGLPFFGIGTWLRRRKAKMQNS